MELLADKPAATGCNHVVYMLASLTDTKVYVLLCTNRVNVPDVHSLFVKPRPVSVNMQLLERCNLRTSCTRTVCLYCW